MCPCQCTHRQAYCACVSLYPICVLCARVTVQLFFISGGHEGETCWQAMQAPAAGKESAANHKASFDDPEGSTLQGGQVRGLVVQYSPVQHSNSVFDNTAHFAWGKNREKPGTKVNLSDAHYVTPFRSLRRCCWAASTPTGPTQRRPSSSFQWPLRKSLRPNWPMPKRPRASFTCSCASRPLSMGCCSGECSAVVCI